MSSFEERLKKAIAEHPAQMDIKEIPDKIDLKITKEEWKKDQKGNDALFITYVTKDNVHLTQKYGFSAFEEIQKVFSECGGIEKLKSEFRTYCKRKVGRAFFDRLYPIPSVPSTQKKKA